MRGNDRGGRLGNREANCGLTMLDLGHLDSCTLIGHFLKVCVRYCPGKPAPVLSRLGMEAWVLLVWDAVALG